MLWLESGRATVELLIFALKYIEEDVSADHIQKLRGLVLCSNVMLVIISYCSE